MSIPALARPPAQLVAKHKVVLFMKGTPSAPMCGFSNRVVQLLYSHGPSRGSLLPSPVGMPRCHGRRPLPVLAGADIKGVDVLSDPVLRNYMKDYSQWPTFPQLYVGGEFVGGCDITTQLHQSGELGRLLAEKGGVAVPGAAPAAAKA